MRVFGEVQRVLTDLPEAAGVAAVSGGADSVALVRALHAIRPSGVVVAHLNHQLRDEASDGDEAFVRNLANQLDLPSHVERVNVGLQADGENLEAVARKVRYAFLAEVAAEVGAGWVATGHTADDQAETVLHRVLRGTGLQGLRGIARQQPFGSALLVRPLLAATRTDVLEYLASLDQPYREDASNSDPRFTRNRIRHELLPALKTFNPAIVPALGRLAKQAGEAFEVLDADAAGYLEASERPRAGPTVILDAAKLESAHPYRVRELFRRLWQREGWPTGEITADHWTRLVAIARGDCVAADFPAGIRVRRVGAVVQVGRGSY